MYWLRLDENAAAAVLPGLFLGAAWIQVLPCAVEAVLLAAQAPAAEESTARSGGGSQTNSVYGLNLIIL